MNDEDLGFAETKVCLNDFPGDVHIRKIDVAVNSRPILKYAVFDDIEQVSPVFHSRNYEACKAFASGYSKGRQTDD